MRLLSLLFLLTCSPVLGQTVDWQPTSASINKESVVRVKSGGSGGTGTYIGAINIDVGTRYLVVTAAHVVKRHTEASITCSTGTYSGTAIVCSTGKDVAIVILEEDPKIQSVYVATTSPVLGDTVYGAGYDNLRRYRVYYGDITGSRTATRGFTGKATVSGPAGAMGGNSGGPIFNGGGELVGVISTSQNPRSQYGDTGWTQTHDICQFLGRWFSKRCPPGGCPPNRSGDDSTPNAPDDYELPGSFIDPDKLVPPAPPELTEEQLAVIVAIVLERLNSDPRFVGPPGPVYTPTVELVQDVIATLGPLTIQPAYYEGERLLPTGSPIPLRFGESNLLPPVTLEVESVSGRKTYSQGPLGGTMRTKMGKLE